MIDLQREVGDKVRYVGPEDGYGPLKGTIGTIAEVDEHGDTYITYRVAFPGDRAKWFMNEKLEALDEYEPGKWKTRALKAEAELMEFKKALATLAEG